MSSGGQLISQLNPASTFNGTEMVPLVQSGTTKQALTAAFGIPLRSTVAPAGINQGQLYWDVSGAHPILNIFLGSAWVPIYQIDPTTGQFTFIAPVNLPGSPTGALQAATKAYVDAAVAVPLTNSIVIKGATDCSGNPNYPAANEGDAYYVSVAGKIGGASGTAVSAGTLFVCKTNATVSGTQAAVGASWFILASVAQVTAIIAASALGGDFAGIPGAGLLAKIQGVALSADVLMQGQTYAYDVPSLSLKARSIEGLNYLINPSFDIWQENTTYSIVSPTTKTHVADGWKAATSSGQARTLARVAGFNNSQYALKVTRPVGGTNTNRTSLAQQLGTADSMFLAGKTVTVSFDFLVGANYSPTSGLQIVLYYGTGFEEDIDLHPTSPNFPTGGGNIVSGVSGLIPAPGVITRIPSVPTAIPAGTTEIAIEIRGGIYAGTAGADDSFTIGNVKLEIGNISTHFRKPLVADELLRCMRRYETSVAPGTVPAQNLGTGTGEIRWRRGQATTGTEGKDIQFAVPKRIAPTTITLLNVGAANAQVRNITGSADCTSSAAQNVSQRGFEIACTGNGGGAVGDTLAIHYIADARL